MTCQLLVKDYPRTLVLRPTRTLGSPTSSSSQPSYNDPDNQRLCLVLENFANTNKASARFQPSATLDWDNFVPLLNGKLVWGCLGLIQLGDDAFVGIVTEASRVGEMEGHSIFRMQTVQFISLTTDKYDYLLNYDAALSGSASSTSTAVATGGSGGSTSSAIPASSSNGSLDSYSQEPIQHPCQHLTKVLSTGSFYFAPTFDLTRSMQKRMNPNSSTSTTATLISTDSPTSTSPINAPTSSAESIFETADDHFWWNKYLLKDLLQIREKELSADERDELDNSNLLLLAIQGFIGIADIRIHKSTTRLAIISRLSCKRAGTRYNARGINDDGHVSNFVESEFCIWAEDRVMSFIQVRGSVPVFWEQTGIQVTHKVEISRGFESTAPAIKKHFDELMARYGNVHIVDLLGQKEATSECALSQAYKGHVDKLKQRGAPMFMTCFDFHAYCKNNNYDALTRLLTRDVSMDIDSFGYFAMTSDAGKTRLMTQTGIFRTNCLDCLDRTNVVQTLLARKVMERFSNTFSSSFKYHFDANTDLQSWFSTLWADNGDWLSKVYAGTGALKSSFTRSGKSTFRGMLDDAAKTVNRFVINNFQDKSRQEAIDILLGKMVNLGTAGISLLVKNPLHEAVMKEMHARLHEYAKHDYITVQVGTWNVNGLLPYGESMTPWIQSTVLDAPDIYVIGLQEVVEMTATAIVSADTEKLKQIWSDHLLQSINYQHTLRANQDGGRSRNASGTADGHNSGPVKYVLLRSLISVGIALFVFVKSNRTSQIRAVEGCIKKTGLGGMAGNKGGVALSLHFHDTTLCFLTAHLAAGSAFDDRNRDYWTITDGLLFRGGRKLLDHDVVVWLGDFNYRVALPNEEVRARLKNQDIHYLFGHDQLSQQRSRGAVFQDFEEGPITFMPTYKYDNGTDIYDTSEKARTPSWTDRILYRGEGVALMEYTRAELLSSDHRPVRAAFQLKTLIIDKFAKDQIEREVYMDKMKSYTRTLSISGPSGANAARGRSTSVGPAVASATVQMRQTRPVPTNPNVPPPALPPRPVSSLSTSSFVAPVMDKPVPKPPLPQHPSVTTPSPAAQSSQIASPSQCVLIEFEDFASATTAAPSSVAGLVANLNSMSTNDTNKVTSSTNGWWEDGAKNSAAKTSSIPIPSTQQPQARSGNIVNPFADDAFVLPPSPERHSVQPAPEHHDPFMPTSVTVPVSTSPDDFIPPAPSRPAPRPPRSNTLSSNSTGALNMASNPIVSNLVNGSTGSFGSFTDPSKNPLANSAADPFAVSENNGVVKKEEVESGIERPALLKPSKSLHKLDGSGSLL